MATLTRRSDEKVDIPHICPPVFSDQRRRRGRNKANWATTKLPAELRFVFFMLSERQPKCRQGCGEFSSSPSSKPDHSGWKKKRKKERKRLNKLVKKAGSALDRPSTLQRWSETVGWWQSYHLSWRMIPTPCMTQYQRTAAPSATGFTCAVWGRGTTDSPFLMQSDFLTKSAPRRTLNITPTNK